MGSKAESEKTFLNGFFDNNDTNKDGAISRDEALAQGKRSWWTNWNEVPLALTP